jgi:polysaccharide deacetylase family protein (PEP-CTERM system associated)
LPDREFLEIPITTTRLLGRNFPCGGGGYFRLWPYSLSAAALRGVNRRDGRSCVFYFHPWELDPDQPRIPGARPSSRFRHYLNLHRMAPRIRRLLKDFSWRRMDEVFLGSPSSLENL